jgi:acyl carrier protein
MDAEIRQALADYGRLAVPVTEVADDDDLYRLGLTSHASVNLMLGLEDAFDIEFPERLLRKSTFGSIAAIRAAVDEVRAESSATPVS